MTNVLKVHMAYPSGRTICGIRSELVTYELDEATCQICLNPGWNGQGKRAPVLPPPTLRFRGYPTADYCETCGLSGRRHWAGCGAT